MKKVEVNIEINISPSEVLNAFTDLDLLKEWWGVEKGLIDDKEKGSYSLLWGISNEGIKYVFTGTIDLFIPGRILYLRNLLYFNPEREVLGPLSLFIEVKEVNNITLLELTEEGFGEGVDWDWYYNENKKAWPELLENLKTYLEKKFKKESDVLSIEKNDDLDSQRHFNKKSQREKNFKLKDLDEIVDKIIEKTDKKSEEKKLSGSENISEKKTERKESELIKDQKSKPVQENKVDDLLIGKTDEVIQEKKEIHELLVKEGLEKNAEEKSKQEEKKNKEKDSVFVKEKSNIKEKRSPVLQKKSVKNKDKEKGKEKKSAQPEQSVKDKAEDLKISEPQTIKKFTWADENTVIRRADFYEAEILTTIAHASKRLWNYPEEYIRIWKNDLTVTPIFIETNPVYCAVNGSDIVGFYALSSNELEYELEHLWVKPEYIRMGVGSKLFDHAVQFISVNGGGILNIVTDPHAEVFYLKKGATLVGVKPSKPEGRKLPHLQYYIK